MAITQPARRSEAATFLSGAPDGKPAPKLRGQRRPTTFSLPPDLVAEIDGIVAEESRSRARMIEIGMRQFIREYRRREAA